MPISKILRNVVHEAVVPSPWSREYVRRVLNIKAKTIEICAARARKAKEELSSDITALLADTALVRDEKERLAAHAAQSFEEQRKAAVVKIETSRNVTRPP
eukprot:SAG11_NODE_17477_length_517_cov_1.377990_1_plen_101_part_00